MRIYGILVLIISILITSCATKTIEKKVYKGEPLEKIAILPVQRQSEDKVGVVNCPITDRYFDASPTTQENANTLNKLISKYLSHDPRFFTVSNEKCYLYFNAIINENIKSSHLKIIKEIGKEVNADAVLYSRLYRVIEREGGSYGATRPASVAFSMHLIRISDGEILWKYTFDETQKSVLDNILDLELYRKTGIKWLTSEELMDYGVSLSIQNLLSFIQR